MVVGAPWRELTFIELSGGVSDLEWVELPLLPYHAWATRGPSTMRVWLPVHSSPPEQH